MATQVQNRRGTTAEHSTFTGANGELTVDTTKRTLVVHDGATAGGRPLLREDQSNLPTSAPTTGIYNASGSLAFSTTADGASSPTERMRITNTGAIRTFSSAGDESFSARSSSAAGTTFALLVGRHSATDTASGTVSFAVYTNGNVVNTNNSYGALSDIKLKENIVDANSQWNDIKALQVRNYNFKEGQTHTQIGLIAQEVEPISPGLVYESPDRDAEGNDLGTVTKSVNYSVLYIKAVKALQEAMERIEVLEQRLTDAGIA